MIQIALTLWIAGLHLLLQVGNCQTDLCIQARTVANQAITFGQSIVNNPQSQTSIPVTTVPNQPEQNISPLLPSNPVGSTIPSNNQINMETELTCTLSASSNVGAPSSFVNLTWTSNADSATLTDASGAVFKINNDGRHPVSGATQGYRLSSESGEVNTFVMHFVKGNQSKDCNVTVTTQ